MNVALKNITLEFRVKTKRKRKIELTIEISKHLVFLDFFFKDSRLPFMLTAAALKKKKIHPLLTSLSICNFPAPWRLGELCGIFPEKDCPAKNCSRSQPG